MVEVIIPFAGSCPHRLRALSWVRGRYRWAVTVAGADGPWCKARAVMPAVEASCADVLVIADADVWTDELTVAIAAIHAGEPWAVPHTLIHRLTLEASETLYAGGCATDPCEKPYEGVIGGGIVIARRELLLEVPLDPRFVGWGQEDESWGAALRTLAGEPWRGGADLWHLWHPPQERLSRTRGSREGWNLRRRYLRARRDPELMREIVEEAKACLQPC